MARYLPIAEHGVIGDLHTVALVGTAAPVGSSRKSPLRHNSERRGSSVATR
jgi:hypothetical protein